MITIFLGVAIQIELKASVIFWIFILNPTASLVILCALQAFVGGLQAPCTADATKYLETTNYNPDTDPSLMARLKIPLNGAFTVIDSNQLSQYVRGDSSKQDEVAAQCNTILKTACKQVMDSAKAAHPPK